MVNVVTCKGMGRSSGGVAFATVTVEIYLYPDRDRDGVVEILIDE